MNSRDIITLGLGLQEPWEIVGALHRFKWISGDTGLAVANR